MYDEEYENALKESDGDKEYASLQKTITSKFLMDLTGTMLERLLLMLGLLYKMQCDLLEANPKHFMEYLVMLPGQIKTG